VTVDVRCTVVTDRGISTTGSISEDHIDTTNVLARVRGTIEFAGIDNMVRGTAVNVAYSVPGFNQVTRFPRQLWVLSSKVDPFAEITTTEVGCRLTLMGDLRPPDEVQAADADPELPANMQGQIPLPIYARDVLADCLNKIGLTAAAGNTALVSSFLQEQFDTSAGYVQVINDLLASESCYGFVNAAGQFVVRKIRDAGSVAAVLTRDALLTMEGIEGGPPPADQIRVTWDGAVQSPPGLELPEIPVLPELPEVSSIMINGVAISPEQKATLDAKAAEIAAEQNLPLSIAKGIVYSSIKASGGTVTAGLLAASTSQFNDGISGSNVQGASYADQSRRVDDYNQPGTDDPGNPGTPGGLLNWTYEESISFPQTFRQEYVTDAGVSGVDIVVFAAKSVSVTKFEDLSYTDLQGKARTESVKVSSRTVTDSRVGPVNPIRWKSKLDNGSPARAADPVYMISETRIVYTPTKDGLRPLQEVTEEWRPAIEFGAKLGIRNWVGIDLGLDSILESRTETTYDTAEMPLNSGGGAVLGTFDRTKTTVKRWAAWGVTQEGVIGSAAVAQAWEAMEDPERIAGIYRLVENCKPLVFDGIETRISQGRGIVQSLPPRQDQLRDRLTRNTPGGSGFTSLNFSPTGTPTGTARYLLPYPADDTVQGVEVDPVTLQPQVVPGNVQEQARQFGLTQNYLAYGHANGVAITTEIRNLPSEPLGTFCIDAAGVSAVFRSNGQSWAWGPEGMIVGADALLHGTAGTYAAPEFDDCWVPVPVAIDDLVAAASVTTNSSPAPANTITTPGGFDPVNPGSLWGTLPTNGTDVPAQVRSIAVVIEPRNERVAIRATSQAGVIVREYDYPLDLGTEVIQAVTVTSVELPVIVALPVTTITVGPVAPLAYQPAEITLPLTIITVGALAPDADTGGGGGGGGSWSPATWGTTGWFDAGTPGDFALTSGLVDTWNSKSGTSLQVGAAGSKRPAYGSATQNSLNLVTFDGVNDELIGPALSNFITASAGTLMVVFRARSIVNQGESARIISASGAGFGIFVEQPDDIGSEEVLFLNNVVVRKPMVGADTWPAWVIAVLTHGSGTLTAYLNGDAATTRSSGDTEGLAGGIAFGPDPASLTSLVLDIAEAAFKDIEASESDVRKLEGYAAHRWDIQSVLPSDHPYKTAPP
jgi:hypothetical protein